MSNPRTLLYVILITAVIAGGYSLYLGRKNRQGAARPNATSAPSAPAVPPSTTAAAPAGTRTTADSSARPDEQIVVLETPQFRAELTTRGAAVRHFVLKERRYQRLRQKHLAPVDIVSTWREEFLPARVALLGEGPQIPEHSDWTLVSHDERSVVMRLTLPDVEIENRYEIGRRPYELSLTTKVSNRTAASQTHKFGLQLFAYTRKSEEKAGFFQPSPWVTHGLCMHGEDLSREDREDLATEKTLVGGIRYVAIDNLYFTMAALPARGTGDLECRLSARQRFDGEGDYRWAVYQGTVAHARRQLEPGQNVEYRNRLYFGPKELSTLEQAGSGLDRAVDFGFLAVLCRILVGILKFFHGLVGNWGAAIILLTVSIKVLLFPLTFKSMKSMREMQRLKPLMDEINARYKDDRDRRNQATMELYRNHKVNPFSGCLPVVAQAPVWFALYGTLWRAVELYRSPFIFWYQDLSSPDPYFVLPLLLGATMFIQQKITPTTMDAMQQKIMLYVMPAMFMVFLLFLPSGLALYSLINSVLTIAQTQFMYRVKPELAPVQASAPQGAKGASDGRSRSKRGRAEDSRGENRPSTG